MKLQIFEVLSVIKKVVLKRHVVRIPFPVNLAVNLRSVYFDQDEGRKQPRKKDVVHLVTGLVPKKFEDEASLSMLILQFDINIWTKLKYTSLL